MKTLIGKPKEPSKELKIKVLAVHAGPSQSLVNQNLPSKLPEEDYKIYLNNNQLIVQVLLHTNVSDVLDVGQKMLMITLKKKEQYNNLPIHTLPDKELAKSPLEIGKSNLMIWFQPETLIN